MNCVFKLILINLILTSGIACKSTSQNSNVKNSEVEMSSMPSYEHIFEGLIAEASYIRRNARTDLTKKNNASEIITEFNSRIPQYQEDKVKTYQLYFGVTYAIESILSKNKTPLEDPKVIKFIQKATQYQDRSIKMYACNIYDYIGNPSTKPIHCFLILNKEIDRIFENLAANANYVRREAREKIGEQNKHAIPQVLDYYTRKYDELLANQNHLKKEDIELQLYRIKLGVIIGIHKIIRRNIESGELDPTEEIIVSGKVIGFITDGVCNSDPLIKQYSIETKKLLGDPKPECDLN